MIARFASLAFGMIAALALAMPAQAQPRLGEPGTKPQPESRTPAGGLLKGVTVEITKEALELAGYTDVEIYTTKQDRQQIRARIDQLRVLVLHQHCDNNNLCGALSFSVNFGQQDTISEAYMNAWNRQMLYSRLFKFDNGALILQQDVNARDITSGYITRNARMFAVLLRNLMKFNPEQK